MSHKLRIQHIVEYAVTIFFPFEKSHTEKNVFNTLACLISISFIPKIVPLVIFKLLLESNKKIIDAEIKGVKPKLEQMILSIQLNHLQTLTDLLDSDPELVFQTYKKKSILKWCAYYKNEKAHTIILQKYKMQKAVA